MDIQNIKNDFFRLTKISFYHETNYLSQGITRQDTIFPLLAQKTFDKPELLKRLIKKSKQWVRGSKDEIVFAIAGYVHYLSGHFSLAKEFFMKTIEKNPKNLDNWLDLAFALYHLGEKERRLSESIIFNFDMFIIIYVQLKSKSKLKLTEKLLFKIANKIKSDSLKN